MAAFLRKHGLPDLATDLDRPAATPGQRGDAGAAEPFVYVFGRSGFALSMYGANVYPENIAPALHRPEFGSKVTGKFVMELADEGGAPRLQVTIELQRGGATGSSAAASTAATPALASQLEGAIEAELTSLNSEFANYVPASRRAPLIVLRDFGDPRDFPPGAKHRYTRG
jgi:phenylacetate-CoA ligase